MDRLETGKARLTAPVRSEAIEGTRHLKQTKVYLSRLFAAALYVIRILMSGAW